MKQQISFEVELASIPSIIQISDCNPGITLSIPGSGIEKFVIPGYRFWIRLTDWWLFWYTQLT